jgi:hypothetical protein
LHRIEVEAIADVGIPIQEARERSPEWEFSRVG